MFIADTTDCRQVRTRSVAFALLGLLLVFLSSVTYQKASAPHTGPGFVGPLEHLVVAGHHETLRVPGSDGDTNNGDGGPDLPAWPSQTSVLQASSGASYFSHPASDGAVPTAGRYLRPLLRAPPLA